jgi:hypothetical protein
LPIRQRQLGAGAAAAATWPGDHPSALQVVGFGLLLALGIVVVGFLHRAFTTGQTEAP